MNKRRATAVFMAVVMAGLLLGISTPSIAAERTVVLKTPGCVWGDTAAVVRITISRIDGVKSVQPNPIAQTVRIVFDDTKTNPQHFIEALKREGQQVIGEPQFID